MKKELPEIEAKPKCGNEKFSCAGRRLPFGVLEFWRWSASNLVTNVQRGVLAEYIVASAVQCADTCRIEWDTVDLKTPDGIRIEVKSGAYIQSWSQDKFSAINFDIKPTQGWDGSTNEWDEEIKRRSDVYVFCVLAHKEQDTIDPLDLDQWEFYVLPTEKLNQLAGGQKNMTLSGLKKLFPIQCTFAEINAAVKKAANAK